LYYTASGIITPLGGRPVHRLREDIKKKKQFVYYMRFCSAPILPTASQHERMTHTNCCIYRIVPPDDEQ